jgi:Lrp/AsnC family leucine-responsive transcriptional regulator
MAKKFDAVDQAILKVLVGNARTSISDIARKVNRSRTAVEARIYKLEEAGTIVGYSVVLDLEFNPQPRHQAFIMVKHTGASDCAEMWQQLRRFKNILECHSVFGELDLMLKVGYSQLEEIMEIKNFLSANPKVSESVVSPVIKTWLPEPAPACSATSVASSDQTRQSETYG